ncbi:hypothetical protein EGM51_12875 [Verrucomicrobia bacterium S94]|nr:hypothetical protein EGM51_12875 [Verrucomicrobia bacterium S94]
MSKLINNKYTVLMAFLFILFALGSVALDSRLRENANVLQQVDKVLPGPSLKLANGDVIKLAGRNIEGRSDESRMRISKLIGDYEVFVSPNGDMKYDVFIWGIPEEVLGREPNGWESVGAHNVYIGFLNIQKGSCVYLNQVLINEGLWSNEPANKGVGPIF